MIIVTTGKDASIGPVRNRPHPVSMAAQYHEALARLWFPQPGCAIFAPTRQYVTNRAKGECTHIARMAAQDAQALPRTGVPDAHREIIAAACQHTPIRAEGERAHPVRMVAQDVQALPCAGVPETDRLILAAARQQFPIRAESCEPTKPPCPYKMLRHWPVLVSQRRIV